MHPHLLEVLATLDEARAALRAAVDAVPEPLRASRPDADRWSANEVLEHLSLVEQRFGAIIAQRIAEARAAGLGPEDGGREPLPAALRQMQADRAARRNAPDPVKPRQHLDAAAAWSEVERVRAWLRTVLTDADGLALSRVIHTHPVFGTLNVYQLVEFIGAHEARHARQIAGLAESVPGGSDAAEPEAGT